ncbi:MAG: nucleoside 2-deoxyribosyltransferase [Victivallales bacterium]|nr:nucleoside 2-deoxyribosyltransferase [Victivallales bacterium]
MGEKVYFAGELFDHKHLIGNRLLADGIRMAAGDRYEPVLPQETEPPEIRALAIRNHDFRLLFECRAAVFNFDGTDLDSGTVVEFVTAKMLDLPAVILRSDFRHSGDQEEGGDPWNLMCSGYPRTASLSINAMTLYQRHGAKTTASSNLIAGIYGELGTAVVRELDRVMALPPLHTPEERERIYRWVAASLGGNLLPLREITGRRRP